MKKLSLVILSLLIISFTGHAQNLQWAKQIGGPFPEIGYSAVAAPNGFGVYSTGIFYGTVDFDPGSNISNLTSGDNINVYVNKFDLNGNFVWAKRLPGG